VCIKKGKREFKKTLGNKIFRINNIYILIMTLLLHYFCPPQVIDNRFLASSE